MRIVLYLGLLCLVCSTVWAAPATEQSKPTKSDVIEQELVRQHHSTGVKSDDDADDNSYSSEKGNLNDESSPVESIEDLPEDDTDTESYDEDDLYDITVGDVIRDVLMTLHDHPEIFNQLIESEKDKIANRLAQYAVDSVGSDLSDFQQPAEQLQDEPKRVIKKDGKSGQVRSATSESNVDGFNVGISDANDAEFNGYMNHKRTTQGLGDTLSPDSDVSKSVDRDRYDEYRQFLKSPKGRENKYKVLYGKDSQDESESYDYRRHFSDSSASSESSDSEVNERQGKFRFPFIYPLQRYKSYKGSEKESSSKSTETDESSAQNVIDQTNGSDLPETESDSSQEESNSEDSEEQLSWLLRQMEANTKKDKTQENM